MAKRQVKGRSYCRSGLLLLWMGYLLIPYICVGGEHTAVEDISADDLLIERLEEKLAASRLNAQSVPVALSGEGRLKMQFHTMREAPPFMLSDYSWLQSGWAGNEGMMRLAFGAQLGRYGGITAKIGFQHTLSGKTNYLQAGIDTKYSGFIPRQGLRDNMRVPAYIHEDFGATVHLRSGPLPCTWRFGGVQWIESTPLTIWEPQPRLFAWEYLPFEIHESVAMFYHKNMVIGERTGRVAWNKKPFNGIGFESDRLPWGCALDLFYGSFEAYDRHEREYVDLQGERSYYSDTRSPVRGQGIGDTWRHAMYGRVTKPLPDFRSVRDFSVGFNAVHVAWDSDILYNTTFGKAFWSGSGSADTLFFKEPLVASVDVAGTVHQAFDISVECAVSRVDTTFMIITDHDENEHFDQSENATAPTAALYTHLTGRLPLPFTADLFFLQPGFYSPFSFAHAVNGFYPVGANLEMPGKFVASRYTHNMAGADFSAAPLKMGNRGHCRFLYGNSMQVEPGADVIYFPFRLNGADLYSLFQSSYRRWGVGLIDNDVAIKKRYGKRIGDETFTDYDAGGIFGPDAGGLRSDFLSVYESFVPYDSADALENLKASETSVSGRSTSVRSHRKYSMHAGVDASYNVAAPLGWKRELFVSLYATVNGISYVPQVVAFRGGSDENVLWGGLLRCEIAFGVIPRLYLLLLGGGENWYAHRAWMAEADGTAVRRVPIDYRDYAFGGGCDWQLFDRAGLHLRCKWMRHIDRYYPDNDWNIPLVSTELKMWF